MADVILISGIFSPTPQVKNTLSTGNFVIPQLQRPMASYQLAHWLRKNRFSVQVIEFVQLMTNEELIEVVEPFIDNKTICIGLSTVFWPTTGEIPSNILNLVDHFRSRYQNLKLIGGGGRISRPEYDILNFDKIFLHEAENSLLSWLTEQKLKVSMPGPLFNIVDLDHRFIKEDNILDNECLPIELGRGCIFKCKFCNYINIGKKKHTYQRNFDYLVDEMKYNFDNFGTTNYIFLDDTCNEDYDKVKNLSTLPDRLGFDISWIGYLRADLIWKYSDSAELLARSGLLSAYFGLESLHPKASRIVGKGWVGKHAQEYVPELYKNLWNKKINIFSNFILGLPEEPEESFYKTLDWCKKVDTGHFNFYPLVLKTHYEDNSTKSEFDKNYSQYGYTVDSNGDWILKDLSFQKCAKLSQDFNSELWKTNKISGFSTANYLNLGMAAEEIRSFNSYAGVGIIKNNFENFKKKYISKLKENLNGSRNY